MFQMVLEVLLVNVHLDILVNVVKIVSREKNITRYQCFLIFNFLLANPCANNPCGPNGQCIPSNNVFYCECNLGYFGNRCERKLDLFMLTCRI